MCLPVISSMMSIPCIADRSFLNSDLFYWPVSTASTVEPYIFTISRILALCGTKWLTRLGVCSWRVPGWRLGYWVPWRGLANRVPLSGYRVPGLCHGVPGLGLWVHRVDLVCRDAILVLFVLVFYSEGTLISCRKLWSLQIQLRWKSTASLLPDIHCPFWELPSWLDTLYSEV